MLYHHIKEKDVHHLEGVFATLTEEGWVIPDWLVDMRAAIGAVEHQPRNRYRRCMRKLSVIALSALLIACSPAAKAQVMFSNTPLFDIEHGGDPKIAQYIDYLEVRPQVVVEWSDDALNKVRNFIGAHRDQPAVDGSYVCFASTVRQEPGDCSKLDIRFPIVEQQYIFVAKVVFNNGRSPMVVEQPFDDTQLRFVSKRGVVIYRHGRQPTEVLLRIPRVDAVAIKDIYFTIMPYQPARVRPKV